MKIHSISSFFIIVAFLTVGEVCLAATQPDNSTTCLTTYENHNQIDYGPLRVHAIQGTTVIDVGNREQHGVPGACFALFTERDHKLVANVVADDNGHFEIRSIQPGRYRLVARATGLCTANIPLEVVKSSRQKAALVIHFRAAGIDDCSYGELTHAGMEKRKQEQP